MCYNAHQWDQCAMKPVGTHIGPIFVVQNWFANKMRNNV
jgi:hypothetical protein